MNVGIIGARGFVGASLLKHLELRGVTVTGYTRETVDLTVPVSLICIGEHDVVINCAAQVSGSASQLFATNVQGVYSLCSELNRRARQPYLLQLSSGGVYGYADQPAAAQTPPNPAGDYALTKYLGDEVIRLQYRGPWAIARLYFPYGEGQSEERLIPRLIARMLAGETIDVSQHGGPCINPMYIGDLCEQLHDMMTHRICGMCLLGGPDVVSVAGLARMIGRLAGVEVRLREIDGENSNMLCTGTGGISLEQGLSRLIHSMRGC